MVYITLYINFKSVLRLLRCDLRDLKQGFSNFFVLQPQYVYSRLILPGLGSRSLFKYFCGAGAGAGATKILLAPAPVMVHRISFIE